MRLEIPPWMEDDWIERREGPVRAFVRRDFAEIFDRLGLMEAAESAATEVAAQARPLATAGGRGPLAVVPAGPLGEAVVRPCRRGGLPGRLVRRRYLLGQRAVEELVATERLRHRGVPAAEPLAAVHRDALGPGYVAALLTRRVTRAEPATRLLAEGSEEVREDVLHRMGRTTGILHRCGGLHPDLNTHNYLVPRRAGEPAVLLDFDRARVLPGPVPELAERLSLHRLRRSLRKLELERSPGHWDAFLEGYAETRERRSRS